MKKYLGIVAIAAGAVLLTACGEKGSATEDVSAGGAKVDNIANRADSADEPVDCGEVVITDTITQSLIADPTPSGIVGCTEAFNVLDKYLAIPAEDRNPNGDTLSDGWSCATEDGETMYVNCVNEDAELTFHTEPTDLPETVDCGEVQVTDTITHTLVAVPTPTGTVGCTEAFNVLDEYLAIPAEDRELDGTPLSGGWACGTEDGETMLIICGNDNELAFHTQPIDEPLPADTLEPVDCGEVEVTETITHTLIVDSFYGGLVGCTEAFNVLDEYLAVPAEDREGNFQNMPLSNGWACGTDDGETMSIGCVKGGLDADYKFAFHTEPV